MSEELTCRDCDNREGTDCIVIGCEVDLESIPCEKFHAPNFNNNELRS